MSLIQIQKSLGKVIRGFGWIRKERKEPEVDCEGSKMSRKGRGENYTVKNAFATWEFSPLCKVLFPPVSGKKLFPYM